MLFMTIYTWEPGQRSELLKRRIDKGMELRDGVKVLGEWTDLCGGRGFMLLESSDSKALIGATMAWSDFMKIEAVRVIETTEIMKPAKKSKGTKK